MNNKRKHESNLLSEIVKSQRDIREKYKKLKRGAMESEQAMSNTFKVISEPLNTLVQLQRNTMDPEEDNQGTQFNTESMDYEDADETPASNEDKDDYDIEILQEIYKTPTGQKKARDLAQRFGPFSERYILMHLDKNKENNLDKIYGIRTDGRRWLLGNATIEISDDKIYLNGNEYKGTPGLFELLFLKQPDKNLITSKDLKIYKSLLIETSAHKQHYDILRQINSNRGTKYLQVISPLFIKRGQGMRLHAPRLEYWDDPNELVERLKLLFAAKDAGNNNVENEILSISEELREANYII